MKETSFNTTIETQPSENICDKGERLVASGVFDFGHMIPNHMDQVSFRITQVERAYFIHTDYRNIGSVPIGRKYVDWILGMLNSSLCPFLLKPTGTVKITEPKQLFMEKYFSFDDSFRPIEVLLAIAEVESTVTINNALCRLMGNGMSSMPTSDQQQLISWGRYLGSEHIRIPKTSKYHIVVVN